MPNACLSQLSEDASFFPWEVAHAKDSKGVLLSTRAYACILLVRLSLAEIIFRGPHDDSQSTRYAEVLPFSKVHLYWFPASIAGINYTLQIECRVKKEMSIILRAILFSYHIGNEVRYNWTGQGVVKLSKEFIICGCIIKLSLKPRIWQFQVVVFAEYGTQLF